MKAKWKPCVFKACGRTEHVGRARWDAKRGGWQVREMRPGYPPAPSLYGPSAVYSVTWLSRAERDGRVVEERERHAENERRDAKQRLLNAICNAIDAGTKADIVIAAAKAVGVTVAAARAEFEEAAKHGAIERTGRRWAVSHDIPF